MVMQQTQNAALRDGVTYDHRLVLNKKVSKIVLLLVLVFVLGIFLERFPSPFWFPF
jgi:hypothetical protein